MFLNVVHPYILQKTGNEVYMPPGKWSSGRGSAVLPHRHLYDMMMRIGIPNVSECGSLLCPAKKLEMKYICRPANGRAIGGVQYYRTVICMI